MTSQRARDLHFSSVVVDAHSDSLVWTIDEDEDLAADLAHRQLTLPKMRAGGVSAQFFAGWADPARFGPEAYVRRTLEFIDAMYRICAHTPTRSSWHAPLQTSGASRRLRSWPPYCVSRAATPSTTIWPSCAFTTSLGCAT